MSSSNTFSSEWLKSHIQIDKGMATQNDWKMAKSHLHFELTVQGP